MSVEPPTVRKLLPESESPPSESVLEVVEAAAAVELDMEVTGIVALWCRAGDVRLATMS